MRIDIGKRDFVWVGLIIVVLIIGFGYAWGTSNPSVMGHSSGEIDITDEFCVQITNHSCGYDVNNDINAISSCPDDEFLDGDGDCWNIAEIIADAGGTAATCPCGDCTELKYEPYSGCCSRTYICTVGGWALHSDDNCMSCAGM
jgi:hypothetical protein